MLFKETYEEFHRKNRLCTIFEYFKVNPASYDKKKNAFRMIPSSLHIKVYISSYDQKYHKFSY